MRLIARRAAFEATISEAARAVHGIVLPFGSGVICAQFGVIWREGTDGEDARNKQEGEEDDQKDSEALNWVAVPAVCAELIGFDSTNARGVCECHDDLVAERKTPT